MKMVLQRKKALDNFYRALSKSILILSDTEFGTRSIPLGTDLGLSFFGDLVGDLRLLRLLDLFGFSLLLIDKRPYSAKFLPAARVLK